MDHPAPAEAGGRQHTFFLQQLKIQLYILGTSIPKENGKKKKKKNCGKSEKLDASKSYDGMCLNAPFIEMGGKQNNNGSLGTKQQHHYLFVGL